jgi:hypothetical protein
LFRINIEAACFGVSIEPKQRKRNQNKEQGTKITELGTYAKSSGISLFAT